MKRDERLAITEVGMARLRVFLALLIFVVLITTKLFVLQVSALSGVSATSLMIDTLFVFGVLAAVDLFLSDMRYRALVIVNIVFTAIFCAIAVYLSYYDLLPTRSSLAAIGMAPSVGGSIKELISPLQLLMLVDLPVLIWWGMRARRRGVDPVTGRRLGAPVCSKARTPYVYQRRLVYVLATLALLVFGIVVNSVRSSGDQLDGFATTRRHGLAAYLTADVLGVKGVANAEFQGESLQTRIETLRGGRDGDPLGGFEPGSAMGSHVIVIQVEALQGAAVGAKVGDQEVTPNLSALIRESWYFPNHFSAAGRGTTSDTEFTVNTSLYPPVEGAASLLYADRQFTSIPRLLSEHGYRALTFHTNSVSYWNRSQLYPALGFDRYYDDRYFGSAEKIAFGASDRVLFSKTLEELVREDETGRPFYAQVVTMSSHFPFSGVPVKDRKLHFTEEYAGTIEGDYLTEIKYADAELGKFVQGLRESGLLERSILVIHGDHFGLPMPRNEKEKAALELLLGHEYTPVDKLNTPLLVRLPGQVEEQRVTSPAGHVDLMPTLADALGVSMANVPHFGRSIFREGPVLFSAGGLLPPGSFVDERVLYIAGGEPESGEVWDIRTRERAPISAAHADRLEATRQLLRESAAYVQHLPLRADFNPDAERILPTP